MSEEITVPVAECEVHMAGRAMLLCHKHTFALLELADGNGVKLEYSRATSEGCTDYSVISPEKTCWR